MDLCESEGSLSLDPRHPTASDVRHCWQWILKRAILSLFSLSVRSL